MNLKRVLIQGAMDVETDYLIHQIQQLDAYQSVEHAGFTFHEAVDSHRRYIVSTTGMGTVNAALATSIALEMFRPTVVINQGTAGAQRKELGNGDVVLAERAVNINCLSMPKKKTGEGSDPFSWDGFHTTYYESDEALMELFSKVEYTQGVRIKGAVATGDLFSREDDRILWLAQKFGTVCEDMETAAVYQTCQRYETPCMGIRIISNNELIDEPFNEETAQLLQQYVWKVVSQHI